MANSKITWTDKESLVTDPTIAEKNKVTDSNMNEIKSVVNENADQTILSDTEPTSTDNEIWVDTSSNATYINSEISNEYGTSQNLGYSQKYQNEHNVIVSTDTPTTSERVWFAKSKNLFDKSNVIDGKYIDGSGNFVDLADNFIGDFIKIDNTKTYVISATSSYTKRIAYYTSAKAFISRETTTDTSKALTIPNNAVYCRLSAYNNDLSSLQLEQNSSSTTYEPYTNSSINVDNEIFTETVSVGEDKNNSRVWFKQEKNIINTKDYIASTTTNGITYSNNGDGTFSLSGTATADTTIVIIPIGKIDLKASQPYYLYSSEPYNIQTFNLSVIYNDNGIKYLVANNTVTPTNTPTSVRLSFYIANGKTVNAKNVRLKLLENSKYIRPSINVDNEEICNLQTYSNYSIINGLKICYGEVSSGSVSANAGKDLSIDLPTTYTDTNYKVIASINTGLSYWAELNLTAHSDTTSKIEISLWNNGANATDCTISYIVIGK